MDAPDIRINPVIVVPPFNRTAHCRDIGHLGGTETVRRHGITWMRERGAEGFAVYCQLHHSGNKASARAALMASKPQTFSGRM